jgi:uncharacterized membrane protein YkoI
VAGKTDAEKTTILAGMATISEDQARTAALAGNAGATVTTAQLDVEDGGLIYRIKLSNEVEVEVDAGTGAVLDTEKAEND